MSTNKTTHTSSFTPRRLYLFEGVTVYLAGLLEKATQPLDNPNNLGLVLLLAPIALPLASVALAAVIMLVLILTPLAFLLFLPVRFLHSLWLLWRHIGRRCPYDDCNRAGLPIHACSCGERYEDLLPSYHGIFFHTCSHGAKEVRLPTMDFLGRNKLPRFCRHCKRPLVLSSFGELPEWPIAVVGGPYAGKTLFLRQGIRAVRQRLASLRGASVQIDAQAQAGELERDLRLLDRGQVLAKTAGDVTQAFGLALRIPKPAKLRCLLYLFDSPGEDFLSVARFGRKENIRHLKGIVLLVDPFSLRSLAEHLRRTGGAVSQGETPLEEVVSVLIAGVNQHLGGRPGQRCTVPLAVVLGKTDALPARALPFLEGLHHQNGCPHDDSSDRCREALIRLGGGNSVRALEQKFSTVRFFACSALGRMPDPKDSRPFEARGVAEPLLWLLGIA